MANSNIMGRDPNQDGPIAGAQLRQWIAEGRVQQLGASQLATLRWEP
jgi:hypothetical protein